MDDLNTIFYLKLTASAQRGLESAVEKNANITFCVRDGHQELQVCTPSSQVTYVLEAEDANKNFFIAKLGGSNGSLLGPVSMGLRVRATEETFERVREKLAKGLENSIKQRQEVMKYQKESVTAIRRKRRVLSKIIESKHQQQSEAAVSQTAQATAALSQPAVLKSAVDRRKALEARYRALLTQVDEKTRQSQLEAVRRDLFALVDELRRNSDLVEAFPMKTT